VKIKIDRNNANIGQSTNCLWNIWNDCYCNYDIFVILGNAPDMTAKRRKEI